jgi:hypothetical protein
MNESRGVFFWWRQANTTTTHTRAHSLPPEAEPPAMTSLDIHPDSLPLPPDWVPLPSASHPDQVYYYNVKSRVSQWSRPEPRPDPASVRARHILIKHAQVKNPVSKGANPGPVSRAPEDGLRLIEELHQQVMADPSKFADVATKHSECNSYVRGGDLGNFKHDKMHKEFADAAFALHVNQVSGVVASPSGYHVIMRSG